MRLEGDIEVIRKIEKFILDNTQCDVIKNVPHDSLFSVDVPSYYTKTFVVYVMFFEYDIRLAYDLRFNKGKFEMRDYNSHVLFTKHPELATLLSQMSDIKISEYSGGKQSIEKMPIQEKNSEAIRKE